jgi:5'-deoxynucleotidase YfbR-like HD superfamily hydrolase
MIRVQCYIPGFSALIDASEMQPEHVDLEDIANTLSRCNRFGGRTPRNPGGYSVAQHAVLVSYLCSRKYAYEALHHDDTEAYIGDIIGPFKTDEQRAYEALVRARIAPVLGLAAEEPQSAKDADARALRLEQSIVQGRGDVKIAGIPLGQLVHLREAIELMRPMHPARARDAFLARHEELEELAR